MKKHFFHAPSSSLYPDFLPLFKIHLQSLEGLKALSKEVENTEAKKQEMRQKKREESQGMKKCLPSFFDD